MRLRFAVAVLLALTATSAAFAQDPVRSSIVRVYATSQSPNYWRPWEMDSPADVTGSGSIIEGNRILTSAHVVADQTFLQVQRADQADKHVASVAAVSHELDLAVLTVQDDSFFEGAMPLPIGTLPEVGDTVVALGFPEGGSQLAVTEGVVSRIERKLYTHSWNDNLVVQIDAPINPGSSGGPVLGDTGIAGVAFQAGSGENIGYMVPAPVIEHFLTDIEDGRVDGSPILAVEWQMMENPQLRRHYGMAEGQPGVLLTKVEPAFEGDGKLQERDVLLGIDGFDVANDGTIELRPGERIDLHYAVDRRQIGDSVVLHLLRDGNPVDVQLELVHAKHSYAYLVPRMSYDATPSYFVYGGLVFAPLTINYMLQWGEEPRDMPIHFRRLYYEARSRENAGREQVVVLIGALPSEVNVGYVEFEDSIVDTVDGQGVASLSHLVELLESREGESHRIMLEDSECEIVLRHEDVDRRSHEILDRYRVPSDRSSDLLAVKSLPPVDTASASSAELTTDEPSANSTSAASRKRI
ncbi:MAG TPA: serine protease [Thermoanaerobaculales bacterium]|nr:serine protease [Thermoanaerobaculales bacterium]